MTTVIDILGDKVTFEKGKITAAHTPLQELVKMAMLAYRSTAMAAADPDLDAAEQVCSLLGGKIVNHTIPLFGDLIAPGETMKGGPGSGFHGHLGRPGKIGGSSPNSPASAWTNPNRLTLLKQVRKWGESLSEPQKIALAAWGRSPALIRADQAGKLDEMVKSGKVRSQEAWEAKKYRADLEKALSTGVKYDGTVFRGLSGVSPETIIGWAKDGKVTTNNMQSATTDEAVIKDFTGSASGSVVMRIRQKSGIMVGSETNVTDYFSGADMYMVKNESEVILPANHTYRVKSIRVKTDYDGETESFSDWFSREVTVTENINHGFLDAVRLQLGIDKYVDTGRLYGEKKRLEHGSWDSPLARKAARMGESQFNKFQAQVAADLKLGKFPPQEMWPGRAPNIIIDLEEV